MGMNNYIFGGLIPKFSILSKMVKNVCSYKCYKCSVVYVQPVLNTEYLVQTLGRELVDIFRARKKRKFLTKLLFIKDLKLRR